MVWIEGFRGCTMRPQLMYSILYPKRGCFSYIIIIYTHKLCNVTKVGWGCNFIKLGFYS